MTHNRRVAFMMPGNQVVPTGGTGQFAKSFIEMAVQLGWIVDLVVDNTPPVNEFSKAIGSLCGQVISPDSPYSYSRHRETFAFGESLNLEKSANFRDSLMKAFRTNVYDMILINLADAHLSVMSLGIDEYVPVVFYTHNANMVFYSDGRQPGVFTPNFEEITQRLMKMEGSIVGTQSERNLDELIKNDVTNSVVLPMPLTESGLLEKYEGDKEGVLFIGRWEVLKNFNEYLRVMEQTKLPARVMTNDTGAKKFESEFKKRGITQYDIRIGIGGKEKCDFIRSSRVFYMPSLAESYGFALMECIGHVPSVVLEGLKWYENFDTSRLHITSIKDSAKTIQSLYENPPETDVEVLHKINSGIFSKWVELMENFPRKQSRVASAAIASKDDLFYEDHIKSLGRRPGIEDVRSVLANMKLFSVKYTKDSTWFSKTGKDPIIPQKEDGSLSAFFGD